MDTHEVDTRGQATRQLGAYIAGLRFDDLPAEVVAKAQACVLDALGCCLLGITLPWTRMVLEMALEQGDAPQATILGTAYRTSASAAALVNSTAGHGFELDDIHVAAHLHAGSLCVPVALALGEWKNPLDGRAFLTAIVAGYEVGLRVGLAATGSHFLRGYHFQGTCGVFAAAATAAHLL
ncbi:MAG: MmgE/PrpD family protein, partial [Sulfuricaulis sp.]|nr:MmgE/PrpD family protein [Sulfuricaulis sp.]